MKKVVKKSKSTVRGSAPVRAVAQANSSKQRSFPIVGIGASAGGFEAFSELLHHLPAKTGMAFVFIQHLDPSHDSALPGMLGRATKLPVVEVHDGVRVEPDHVYVIPANSGMILEDGVLRLGARVITRGQHLPVDQFFRSLADERNNQAIGVILSGTASDGTEGCRAIKAAGGISFAQDEESAKFPGMPRSAIIAACIDFVLKPKEIAEELVRIGQHPYVAQFRKEIEEPVADNEKSDLNYLISMVREATGVDFELYKQTTLQRRIKRRMLVHHLDRLKDYVAYVSENPEEIDRLYRDLLIHVTGFFRDSEAFDSLRQNVLPEFFRERKVDESPIRIWVPGCSTGEEVYSIAIVLLEYMWEQVRHIRAGAITTKAIQIFGTDISDSALDRARSGLYTEAALADVSPERIKRFFVRLDGGYQINKSIREMCIFARQNLAKDPPFSNLDLVSCRNLLIYLGPALQKRVIPTLHYALKPSGYLMLGGSESLGVFSDHFVLVDKKQRIYQKKRTAARLINFFTNVDYGIRKSDEVKAPQAPQTELNVEKEVERILVNRFVPASIVVNDEMEIVQFRGRTGDYLEPAAGHPTFSVSKMAREGLLVDLRAALNKAKKENEPVRVESAHVKSSGGTKELNFDVIPVRGPGSQGRFYIVVFQPVSEQTAGVPATKTTAKGRSPKNNSLARDNDRMRREVDELRGQLQNLVEEHESTAEEYKSANEEVLSSNEELQSTNEELETAKEELQSSNEELTTLNEELQNRNVELSLANSDLMNLLGNVNIPVVMVGDDLRIRRFTPPAQKLLNLIPADIGRRLGEIRPNLDLDNLEEYVRETIDTTTLHEQEVREKDGPWHLLRIRPYKTWDNKIDGAVISFQDIDVLKRTIDLTRDYADTLIENAREPIVILDPSFRISAANSAFYRHFQVNSKDTEGRLIYDLGNRQWNIPRLRELLEEIAKNNTRIDDFEVSYRFPNLGHRTMVLNARRIEPQSGRQMILLAIEDITDRRKYMETLQQQAALLELAHDTVIVRDFNGFIHFWNRGAEQMYGWRKEEVVGKNILDVLHTQFPAPFENIRTQLASAKHWEGELVHQKRDGTACIVDSRWAVQDREGEESVVLEINSDVSARKKMEESMRQLSSYLMRVQDDERRRIARDLHDSTGQKLVALKMNVSSLAKQMDGDLRNKKVAEESVVLVDDALSEIRSLAQLLHPPLLDEAGLISATRWLAESFGKRAGIQIDVEVSPRMARLPDAIELALFRVVQESLNNIHRHSGAKKATIGLWLKDHKVKMEIRDNGKGMGSEAPSKSSDFKPKLGVGILGMKERISQLGGMLEIDFGAKGTVVSVQLSLPKGTA